MEQEAKIAEDDKFLDPIAKSILRDLQADADEDEHANEDHISAPGTVVLGDGRVIHCEGKQLSLSWNELVHCNIASEQDGNDSDGSKGGVIYAKILDTPLSVVIDKPNDSIIVILEDGTIIRCGETENPTENEVIHCKMALEQNGLKLDGTPIGGQLMVYQRDPDEEPSDGNGGVFMPDGTPILGFTPDGWPIVGFTPDGQPILGFMPNGAPIIGYTPDVAPILGFDPDGTPILGLNKDGTPITGIRPDTVLGSTPDGKPIVGYTPSGKPILGFTHDKKPILGYNEDGEPIVGYMPDGASILGYTPDGTPILGYNPDGTPILALDPDGNPILGWGPEGWANGTAILSEPTAFPTSAAPTITASPTITPVPTAGPSYHPTLHGDPFTIRGTVYYDYNGNGRRDPNIDTRQWGNDIEYNYGLGGVTVQLMECDPETNKGLVSHEVYKKGDNSYVSTVSQGFDVKMHSKLVGQLDNGGKYDLIDIKVNRAYYVYVEAPQGYLFSGGICNDREPGWKCNYGKGYNIDSKRLLRGSVKRSLDGTIQTSGGHIPLPKTYTPPSTDELNIGVSEGRSEKCVKIDRFGMPESNLDVGVMRIGDPIFGDTAVDVSLSLIKPDIAIRRGRRERDLLSLLGSIQERILNTDPVKNDDGTYTYVLVKRDKDAIGEITAEVLASRLDVLLPKKGAVLDSVAPMDVLYFAPEPKEETNLTDTTDMLDDISNVTADTSRAAAPARDANDVRDATSAPERRSSGDGGKLSVSVIVRGHYHKDDELDFDFIVQDSINRDTPIIREQLTNYNENCRDQRKKVVVLGFTVEDFLEIHSNYGVDQPRSRLNKRLQQELDATVDEQAFSSACNQKQLLPDYFEASLGGLTFTPKTETYVVEEGGGASTGPIVGGILAVGAFALLTIFFMYRRGIKKKKNQPKEVKVTHVVTSRKPGKGLNTSVTDKIQNYDVKISLKEKQDGKDSFTSVSQSNRSGSNDLVMIPVDEATATQHIGRVVQQEFSNMAMALNSERRRLQSDGKRKSSGLEKSDTSRLDVSDVTGRRSMKSGTSHLDISLKNSLSEREGGSTLPPIDTAVAPKYNPKSSRGALSINSGDVTKGEDARASKENGARNRRRSSKNTISEIGKSREKVPSITKEDFEISIDDLEKSDSSDSSSSSSSSSSDDESQSKNQQAIAAGKRKENKTTNLRRRDSENEGKRKKKSSTRRKKTSHSRDFSKSDFHLHSDGRKSAGDEETSERHRSKCDLDIQVAHRRVSNIV